MKTLQEIQEFNRRKIICAVHETKDYEEALQVEGNNIELNRVLLALDFYDVGYIASSSDKILTIEIGKIYNNLPKKIVFDWNLTEPTLEKQNEETQRAIYELLKGKNL